MPVLQASVLIWSKILRYCSAQVPSQSIFVWSEILRYYCTSLILGVESYATASAQVENRSKILHCLVVLKP